MASARRNLFAAPAATIQAGLGRPIAGPELRLEVVELGQVKKFRVLVESHASKPLLRALRKLVPGFAPTVAEM
jgi:hypothetical protein